MITAYSKTIGKAIRVDGLCNKGEWFGDTWLIGIGCGFDTAFYVAEAGSEGDAIDVFVDSKHGHMVKTDELCDVCEAQEEIYERCYDECTCDFAGNYGDRIDLTDLRILERCKVEYFTKK